jgi:hypothetical protein
MRREPPSLLPYTPDAVTWAAAVVAVLALAIYVRTLLPGVGFWDTAEAQTVPPTGSIFHPTGFPTYAIVGWLWSRIPFGEMAYRMNLLSAVSVSLAAGLVVLIAGRLIEERSHLLAAAAAGIGGLAFAFASEPWDNAVRADVHALHILFVALIVWLLLVWRTAFRSGSPRAGRWLAASALVFGLGLGNHPLIGLLAVGIAGWLFWVDPRIWRRWRLMLGCGLLVAIGLLTYLYIPIRASASPEPPLNYADPDTWERFRYLVFAEQFSHLFTGFNSPFADFGAKWAKAESVLAAQFVLPGWLLVAIGAATLAVRQWGALVFLGLIVVANVFYAMNFQDGDIDRYYLGPTLVAATLLGVAVAAIGGAAARSTADATARLGGARLRRRAARAAGASAIVVAALLPLASLVTLYESRDRSDDREAERWVASVYEALPRDAVVISWWSYSTPLWYYRWVLGERPDVTVLDERNLLDDGYGSWNGAIDHFLGLRPVYLIAPSWVGPLLERYETTPVPTYAAYQSLLRVEGQG